MVVVSSERGHASRGPVSVAWVTDTGPREENQDRAVVHVHDHSSWLIGVADGLGGHPRGAEAAQAAIDGMVQRIASAAEMWQAFSDANERGLYRVLANRKERWSANPEVVGSSPILRVCHCTRIARSARFRLLCARSQSAPAITEMTMMSNGTPTTSRQPNAMRPFATSSIPRSNFD